MTAFRAGRVRFPDGRPVSIVQEYETHSAQVFVTETHAFKIRKPVSLGFLDYSTEDNRREAARTEVLLGRRVSPQVHLGVWTLTHTESPILLPSEDSGEPVVAMNRLPEALQLELLFSDPRTPDGKIDAVASACARFHALCPVDTRIDGYGSIEKTTEAWAVNFEQLSATDATIPLTPSERQQLITETAAWLKSHRDVLVQRITEGRIREGHGDLRLQHVYLTEPWSVIDPLDRTRYGLAYPPISLTRPGSLRCDADIQAGRTARGRSRCVSHTVSLRQLIRWSLRFGVPRIRGVCGEGLWDDSCGRTAVRNRVCVRNPVNRLRLVRIASYLIRRFLPRRRIAFCIDVPSVTTRTLNRGGLASGEVRAALTRRFDSHGTADCGWKPLSILLVKRICGKCGRLSAAASCVAEVVSLRAIGSPAVAPNLALKFLISR